MWKVFQSWFFFTSLLLFLIAAVLALPVLKVRLLGNTEQQFTQVIDTLESEIQSVWAPQVP